MDFCTKSIIRLNHYKGVVMSYLVSHRFIPTLKYGPLLNSVHAAFYLNVCVFAWEKIFFVKSKLFNRKCRDVAGHVSVTYLTKHQIN
jgi:hypothetical protein